MCKGTSEGEGQQQCVCLLSFLLGNNLCSSMRHHCLSLRSAPFFPLLKAVLQWPTCILCVCVCVCAHARTRVRACSVPQSCLTLCNPMNCSLSSSTVHGIFQVRILEQVAFFPLQGIFPTQGWKLHLLHLLYQ